MFSEFLRLGACPTTLTNSSLSECRMEQGARTKAVASGKACCFWIQGGRRERVVARRHGRSTSEEQASTNQNGEGHNCVASEKAPGNYQGHFKTWVQNVARWSIQSAENMAVDGARNLRGDGTSMAVIQNSQNEGSLHQFRTPRRYVLGTAARYLHQHGDEISEVEEELSYWGLRGHAAPYNKILPLLLEDIRSGAYGLVIIDPTYKILGDLDENKAGDIAKLMNELENVAHETGCN